jgi:hypothetical protein
MTDSPALTPEALDTIEARTNAATEGPWRSVCDGVSDYHWIKGGNLYRDGITVDIHEDAEFIAHAREDIPALVVELRRLRTENEELRIENEDTATELSNLSEGNVQLFDEQAATIRALQAKIDAALVEVESTDLESSEALQEDLASRVRAALTGEATEQKEALEPTTCVSCRHNIFHIDEGWIHSYPGLDEKHAALPSHAPLTGGAGE